MKAAPDTSPSRLTQKIVRAGVQMRPQQLKPDIEDGIDDPLGENRDGALHTGVCGAGAREGPNKGSTHEREPGQRREHRQRIERDAMA